MKGQTAVSNDILNAIDAMNEAPDNGGFTAFWYAEKGKIKINAVLFIAFLEYCGFRTTKINGVLELVKIDGCLVERTDLTDIKVFVLRHEQIANEDTVKSCLIDSTRLWSMKYLDVLQYVELPIIRDNAGSAFFCFNNGIVEVTKEGINSPIPYNDYKHLIWKTSIMERSFNSTVSIKSDFEDFVLKISNNDDTLFHRLRCILGCCLHTFKNPDTLKAIIIDDDNDTDQPDGGSGKSLLVTAIAQLRNRVKEDGKNFNIQDKFALQKLKDDTQIYHIDDADRNTNLKRWFAIITEGMTIEKKNALAYTVPPENCPRIIFTTNTVISGSSGSFERRQFRFSVHNHFSSKHTPFEEYGKFFFTEWNTEEWQAFDLFMINCVKTYLSDGIPEYTGTQYKRKDAIRATSHSFVEWFEEYLPNLEQNEVNYTTSTRDAYKDSGGLMKMSLSERKFLSWIIEYCNIFEIDFKRIDSRPRGFAVGKACSLMPF